MKQIEKNDLFQAAHLTILLSYTIFSVILTVETFVMNWETWPLVPILVGVAVSWMLHIHQSFTDRYRIWIYAAFIMFTFFFYGSHRTSVFDTVAVMALLLILYTMAGIKPLITFLQWLYYMTFAYGLVSMWSAGETFDSLIISRSLLHVSIITAIAVVSRKIIDKWTQVMSNSKNEIDNLTDATNRLNDFLANVSHETRTPINAVIGLTGICIEEEHNDEKRANLMSVREAGRRVAEQISDILDFTEIDRKNLTNNYEDYMLSSLLNDLVEEIRPFKPDDIELIIDVDPAIPSVMNTDISKLRKILRHLIMNGIKYTHEGGVYVRLYPIKETYGVNLVIKVTDTGIGMTEEEMERVFERYYQVDSSKTRQGGGLGLGMTIVSGFTAALGGFLTLDSKPGVGTCVSVSIPQKVTDPSSCMSISSPEKLALGAFLHLDKYPNPNVREYYNQMIHNIVRGFGVQMHRVDTVANLDKLLSSAKLTHLFVAEEEYMAAADRIEKLASEMFVVVIANRGFRLPLGSHARIMEKPFYCFPVAAVLNADRSIEIREEYVSFPGIQALAVDDEPMNLIVATNILKRYGITVTSAHSGMEAVELCQEQKFDIIFMDHMMPGMDGIETMKRIRANSSKSYSNVPIVALTANAVSTARATFMAAGFDGFVSKPIELVELERVLKRVLSHAARFSKELPVTVQEQPAAAAAPVQPEPAAAPQQAQSDAPMLDRLADYGMDLAEGLKYCDGDEAFYVSLLKLFAGEYDEKRGKMDEYFAAKDLKNYEILVHALKSTLKMLGNPALSERAREMEFAAKQRDYEKIAAHHAALMTDYSLLTDAIREVCGMGTPSGTDDDVMEFPPDDEAMEFAPDGGDEILEFAPNGGEQ